jgi:hypothetical protein
MSGGMKYIPQADGSVAWFNEFNPNQHGVITDPGMIARVGAMENAKGYGTASGTAQANIDYGPQMAAQKGAETYQASLGTERGKQAAAGGGLGGMNTDIMAAVPGKVQDALSAIDSEGVTPVTGISGSMMAMKPGTGAANLQANLNQIESALTSAFINRVKATSPEGRGASTEQVEQFKKSLGLNIGDKESLRQSLLRLQGSFAPPRRNPPVNLTPGNRLIQPSAAGEGQTSGGFRIMKVTPPNGG